MAKTKEDRVTEKTRKEDQRTQAVQTRRGQQELQRPQSPFAFMRRFNEEMDRLFQDFGFGRGLQVSPFGREPGLFGESRSTWSPQVEVIEHGGKLVVRADLPGMTRDDIEVDVTDNRLVIRGERRSEHEEEEEGYYRSERSYGSFYRAIPLPEGVDAENADATFRNGVLEITMPAPELGERRRLEIREGEKEERPKAQARAAGQR